MKGGAFRVEETVSVDIQKLEKQYGSEFTKEIKEHIEYCEENSLNFKLVILESTSAATRFVFGTRTYCELYQVSKSRKKISDKAFISFVEVRKTMELMESIQRA
jgi:hypothetical protein